MRRTVRLEVELDYDDELTDEESLASMMSLLVENAASTPGILEEHGDVEVGTFDVADIGEGFSYEPS